MEFKPEKRTVLLWQARIALIGICLSAIFVAFCSYGLFLLFSAVLTLALTCIALFWCLPNFFKTYTVKVTDSAVIIEKGVIIRVSHIMPFKRLVFAASHATPLGSFLNLKGVTLRAARSRVFIPEIDSKNARKLIFALSSGGNAHE